MAPRNPLLSAQVEQLMNGQEDGKAEDKIPPILDEIDAGRNKVLELMKDLEPNLPSGAKSWKFKINETEHERSMTKEEWLKGLESKMKQLDDLVNGFRTVIDEAKNKQPAGTSGLTLSQSGSIAVKRNGTEET